MKETNNLKLKKPAQSDFYNIDDFNYNSDVIDEAIDKIHKQVDGINPDAGSITYDNKMSGLKSVNVKEAIDEVNGKSEANKASILELKVNVNNVQNHKLTSDNGTAILLNIGYDLNILKDTGIYNGNKLINAPKNSDGWFYIEVVQHTHLNGYVYQKATTLSDFNDIQVFHRQMVGDTWGEWRSL